MLRFGDTPSFSAGHRADASGHDRPSRGFDELRATIDTFL